MSEFMADALQGFSTLWTMFHLAILFVPSAFKKFVKDYNSASTPGEQCHLVENKDTTSTT